MPIYEAIADGVAARRIRLLRRRFLGATATLVGIALGSTAMLAVLGPHADASTADRLLLAFWDTLNLVSTVGSLAEEFNTAQRVWASVVIIFGLGAVLYAFGSLQSLLHGGDVLNEIERVRMRRRLDQEQDHVIVCGYGSVGASVAHHLIRSGIRTIVIDRDADRLREADEAGLTGILGDATEDRTLRAAGIERATGLVATLSEDAQNVFLVLIARETTTTLRIVARAAREASRAPLIRAGADRVIVPGVSAGLQLSHLILKPRVSDFVAAAVGEGEYEFGEIEVRQHRELEGHTLRELDLPRERGLLVISVMHHTGKQSFNPGADYRLQGDDILLVVAREGGLDAARIAPSHWDTHGKDRPPDRPAPTDP